MKLLRQLSEVSAYQPESGYASDLMNFVQGGFSRNEALDGWIRMGRSKGSFYKAYKQLKDDLIRLSFIERKDSSELEGKRLEVWEKYCVVRQLLVKQKKAGAVELAIELMRKARQTGFTEVVAGLASLLENHFGVIDYDKRRYNRYRILRRTYSRYLQDEMDVMALQARFVIAANAGSLDGLETDMGELESRRYGSFVYMRFRYSILSLWFNLRGDLRGLMRVFGETVEFYENCEVEVPTIALSALYSRFTPHLVKNGFYADAEAWLSKAMQTLRPGTQTWHRLMLQKACLGLVSGKMGLVRGCLRLVDSAPRIHGNPELVKRWEVVRRFLESEDEVEYGEVWRRVFG